MENSHEKLVTLSPLQVSVRVYAAEPDGFTAECPEIPGCFSEGETMAEAEANIRKAIDSCLSVIFEDLLQRIRPAENTAKDSAPAKQEVLSIRRPELAGRAA